eukprot:GILK01006351.1.p1 GENE.GILK01006351.1~~GILK01006351.1.p1  ORF type:complete len:397 (-),score=30.85 GILK01006351.1:224-1294(-)
MATTVPKKVLRTIPFSGRVLEIWEGSIKVANDGRVLKLVSSPGSRWRFRQLLKDKDYRFTVEVTNVPRPNKEPAIVMYFTNFEGPYESLFENALYSIGAVFARGDQVLVLKNRNSSNFIQFKYKLMQLTRAILKKRRYEEVRSLKEFQPCVELLETSPSWLPSEYDAVADSSLKFEGLRNVFRVSELVKIETLISSLRHIHRALPDGIGNLRPPSDNTLPLYSLPKGRSENENEEPLATAQREAREELSKFAVDNAEASSRLEECLDDLYKDPEPVQITFRCPNRRLEMPLFVYRVPDPMGRLLDDLTREPLNRSEDDGEFVSCEWVSPQEVCTQIDDGMWAEEPANAEALTRALE